VLYHSRDQVWRSMALVLVAQQCATKINNNVPRHLLRCAGEKKVEFCNTSADGALCGTSLILCVRRKTPLDEIVGVPRFLPGAPLCTR